jgi:hypothetical protein
VPKQLGLVSEQFEGITDAGGRFHLEAVPDGNYRVRAEKAGFVDASSIPASQAKLHLAAGENGATKTLTLKITPQGVVSGHVYDEDGDPMRHVDVRCFARASPMAIAV